MSIIEINHLHKVYKGKKGGQVNALLDLSLTISPGEIFGFLGPNGAGKSTTIKTLTGQIAPTTGDAKLQGFAVPSLESRRKLGYLPENPAFFQFLSAIEYLRFVGRIHGMSNVDIARESERVLSLLDLQSAAKRQIRGYSKGMIQRLGLAQAMLHNPDLYILDEPMSGLDPVGRALVKDIIRQLRKDGKTVFFSTHITADVEEVCDRVGVLVSGRLCALENVDTLLQKGIEGYRVSVKSNADALEIFEVQPNDLKDFLGKRLESNHSVERIEPIRQNLEAFFLETVKGVKNANR